MTLQHVLHENIDFAHWDKCIEKAANGCIFAYSWYLNYVTPGWNALVDEDYRYVMPLPVVLLKKTHSTQTPSLVQHLGIYSAQPLTFDICKLFLSTIPNYYKYAKLCLNKLDIPINGGTQLYSKFQQAYEVDLIRNYSILQSHYTAEARERLESNTILKVNIVSGIQLLDLLHLYMDNEQFASHHLSDNLMKQLRNIGIYTLRSSAGEILGAYDHNNNLCAAAFFISSNNKAHMLFYAQTKFASRGYVIEQIVDHFIKRQSEKNITLCEFVYASNTPYLASFGGIQTKYPMVEFDNLPWYIKP